MSDEKRKMWEQMKADLKAQMPDLSDLDASLCLQLLCREIFGVGATIDELRAEHLKSDGPHGSECSACGWFDSARYHKSTGRYLTDDMAHAKAKG